MNAQKAGTAKPGPALDVNFINPFLEATLNVLKVQASTVANPKPIFRKDEAHDKLGDVSGVIGLVSPTFSGTVVISFPESTFLGLMSRMLGETFTTITPEIKDGAGELMNMIFGQAKIVLNQKGYKIQTALPSVVSGKDHSIQNLSPGPVVVVPFETDIGPLYVKICLSAPAV